LTFERLYDFIPKTRRCLLPSLFSITKSHLAQFSRFGRLGLAMSRTLAVFKDFFQRSSHDPAVAAAATVVCNSSPLFPPGPWLDPVLRSVAPHLTETERAAWVAVLTESLRKAAITTPRGVAAFLGQCAAESGGFRELKEDLQYSAARLCAVWPNRFPNLEATLGCVGNPEALANRVYASRMGNGDEASGDGWRFRGRGLIQITGRTAYEQFASAMAMTLEQALDYASSRAGAADSAIWFWTRNGLNALANTWSIDLLTRKISGGTAGAAERNRLCEAALRAIGV
jgi:putative chitinase